MSSNVQGRHTGPNLANLEGFVMARDRLFDNSSVAYFGKSVRFDMHVVPGRSVELKLNKSDPEEVPETNTMLLRLLHTCAAPAMPHSHTLISFTHTREPTCT